MNYFLWSTRILVFLIFVGFFLIFFVLYRGNKITDPYTICIWVYKPLLTRPVHSVIITNWIGRFINTPGRGL
uniref:NADH-plastoquinone oxidoreductase subunit 4 n=1 Tax=Santalum album TaxID=35974 RepID=A0A6M8B1B0_SANAL|nr:NADH-plastoquinone oxidoreductase subunit 4 [Santalum album]